MDIVEALARQAGDDWDNSLPEDREFLKKFYMLATENERLSIKIYVESYAENIKGIDVGYSDAFTVERKEGIICACDTILEGIHELATEPLTDLGLLDELAIAESEEEAAEGLNESVETPVPAAVANYVKAISRTVKK